MHNRAINQSFLDRQVYMSDHLKPDAETMDKVILLRVTPEEHQKVRDIANQEDRTMASAMRRMFRIGLETYQPHTVKVAAATETTHTTAD